MVIADLIDDLDWAYDSVIAFIDEHGGTEYSAADVLGVIKAAADLLFSLKYTENT
jgi:hypothetical protein